MAKLPGRGTPPKLYDTKASLRFQFSDTELWKFLDEHEKKAQQEFSEMMYDLGKIGEESMRDKIRTSGTEWSAFRKSKWNIGKSWAGRVDSGRMIESIASRPRFGGQKYEMEVGYVKNPQAYFGFQDSGFRQLWTAIPLSKFPLFRKREEAGFTEGTHALREARQDMKDAEPRLSRRTAARLVRKGVGN